MAKTVVSKSVPEVLAGVPKERWPRHIAIIMDGNGRWAQARGLPRARGHQKGSQIVQRIVKEASMLGLEQ
ncbi:MAG: undecaprenyl diphosphate synthase family protein, partial [Phycisphaerae bacterium]|nr:undecaprenyl diphosphate synthase family protein [Phycisphaerae bacterium]